MAQLESTQVNGFNSGLDVLEDIYHNDDENDDIIDLVVEILDGHFGLDEEFFLDNEFCCDDPECQNTRSRPNPYE